MSLFDFSYEGAARPHFNWWYNWATYIRLWPIIEVALHTRNQTLKYPDLFETSLHTNATRAVFDKTFYAMANFLIQIIHECGKSNNPLTAYYSCPKQLLN
jgi:hypothetical protein